MLNWFRLAFRQDDFRDDWYGWATNQISHMGLGIAAALALAVVWFHAVGEFPMRWTLWLIVAACYLCSELERGWHGWDSVEDAVFTAGYGAGGSLYLFHEVSPGSPELLVSVNSVYPVLALAAVHLCCGVVIRIRRGGL